MKLYYSPGACSLAPHIVARELGIDIALEKVDTKTKTLASGGDFNKVNSKGYVPALQLDDGAVLTEGPVISQYLADRKGALPAAGTMGRYRVLEMLGFINSEVHKSYGPLFDPSAPEASKQFMLEKLKTRYAWLDAQLAGREYAVGDAFTIADAYLFTVTNWARYVGLDLSHLANIEAYQKRIAARPAVQAAMKAEGLVK